MKLDIIGGCYLEYCRDPHWNELYGSGLRAVHALSDKNIDIRFHTYVGNDAYELLNSFSQALKFDVDLIVGNETGIFEYDHPLDIPRFQKPVHNSLEEKHIIAEFILQFGMLENCFKIECDKAIYDPQSPNTPLSFWSKGSKTNELIWIANMQEIINFTGSTNFENIKEFLFEIEKVHAFVIKQGPEGALLVQKNKDVIQIPVFETQHVWPIGSGDIFSASFAYQYLCCSKSLEESALMASMLTAHYVNDQTLPIKEESSIFNFIPLKINMKLARQVYLAGPFFTFSERWLINEFREQLIKMGVNVFSPYHDVGLGEAKQVASLDLIGLRESDLILSIIDGLDSGTLFEIGYAVSMGKKVIAFSENTPDSALAMLKGTDCVIVSDFTTAIYKTIWLLNKE